jgi:hypothetical protein
MTAGLETGAPSSSCHNYAFAYPRVPPAPSWARGSNDASVPWAGRIRRGNLRGRLRGEMGGGLVGAGFGAKGDGDPVPGVDLGNGQG